VTIQAQILELMQSCARAGMAVVWITHDLGVIAGIADRVMVMYGGRSWSTGRWTASLPIPAILTRGRC
jgi:ABC-type dipeptide/oligopeptide/nickel transport system ATPase component